MSKVLIYGSGGHSKVVSSAIATEEIVYIDDLKNGLTFNGQIIETYSPEAHLGASLIICVGDNYLRESIANRVEHRFTTIVANSALLDSSVVYGEGCQILHNAVIQSDTVLGRHTIVNTSAIVEHDCHVGNFTHIGPNSTICGGVEIGDSCLIGAGSVIIPGVTIGDGVIIAAGAVVTKDILSNTIFYGNSSRPIQTKGKDIYLSDAHLSGLELDYMHSAFVLNELGSKGSNIDCFQSELEEIVNTQHSAALNSGTAALHLALILLGVEQDDEVLCSTFTFCATANAIAYQKAIPIFIDSEPDTWNMCPKTLKLSIEDRIAKGKKPKAVIVVHLYGMPSKMDELMSVCQRFDIPIIEDSAEALGAMYKGQQMGTFGKFGVYSFNGNKIITTSGGGALVSNDKALIDQSIFLATQARDKAPHYEHSHIGYNYRMSNVVAGIGRGQLQVLNKHILLRRANNAWYQKILSRYEFIDVFKEPSDDYFSNHWLTCIIVHPSKTEVTAEKIRLALEEDHIECRPLWKPMHLQPVFKSFPKYLNGVSDNLFKNGLCLPSGSNLDAESKKRIEVALHKVLTV